MYYNQNDYAKTPYPAPGYESATVKSGGCGPTAMAMLMEDILGKPFPPDMMAAYAIKCGARVSGGTDMGKLCRVLAGDYGIKHSTTDSSVEALIAMSKGSRIIANVGGDRAGHTGLFSDGGHFIYLRSAEGTRVTVWDPGYYSGKYNKPGRKGRVEVQYPDLLVEMVDIDLDCQNRRPRYYIMEGSMDIKESKVKIGDTEVPSVLIGDENYVKLRPMLDAINKHTCLTASWSQETGAVIEVGE